MPRGVHQVEATANGQLVKVKRPARGYKGEKVESETIAKTQAVDRTATATQRLGRQSEQEGHESHDKTAETATIKPRRPRDCGKKTKQVSEELARAEVAGSRENVQSGKERSKSPLRTIGSTKPLKGPEIRGRRRRVSLPVSVIKKKDPVKKTKPPDRSSREASHARKLVSNSAVNRNIDEAFREVCSLSQRDISNKSAFIRQDIEQRLIQSIRLEDERFDIEILKTGSYYEGLKVQKANEIDLMLVLKSIRVGHAFVVKICPNRRHSRDLIGYAYLEYQAERDPRHLWSNLISKGPSAISKVLSPKRLLKRFKELVENALSKSFKGKNTLVTVHGPAINVQVLRNRDVLSVDLVLSVEVPNEWPSIAGLWGVFPRKWPSTKAVEGIRRIGYHLVPKICPVEVDSPYPMYWRVSFSKAEKELLRAQAINDDKKYYRLVKYIFEQRREELSPLCSYHMKTLLLHRRAQGKSSMQPSENKLEIVNDFLRELSQRIKRKNLRHFFISDLNLFDKFTMDDVTRMTSCLDDIIDGFQCRPMEFLKTILFPSDSLSVDYI